MRAAGQVRLLEEAFEGFFFGGGGLEVEGAHEEVFFGFRGGVVFDGFGDPFGAFGGAAAPEDVAALFGGFGVGDEGEVGVEAGVPLEGGADAEGFEVPAIGAVVLGGELGPERGEFFGFFEAEGDEGFAADGGGGILDEDGGDGWEVVFELPGETDAEAADVLVLVGEGGFDGVGAAVREFAEGPEGAGFETGVGAGGELEEGGDGGVAGLLDGLPCEEADFLVRIAECGGCAFR